MIQTAIIGCAAGVLCAMGGVGLLRSAWRRSRPAGPTLAGWGLIAAATAAWALVADWDTAVALALLFPSLAGLGLVAANAEVRTTLRRRGGRAERAAIEPPDRSSKAVWRGLARTLCAGPVAGAAAVLFAAAWALKGAGSEADRIAVAQVLAPVLWAAGLLWATTDGKLIRIAGGLGALALAGGLAAVL